MVTVVSNRGKINYGWKEFVLDSAADIVTLPTNCAIGSRAFVIADSTHFMLNSLGKWVEIQSGNNTPSGGVLVTTF
jgi:hypothetical protein